MASFGYYNSKTKSSDISSDEGLYYAVAKQDQLEKAIEAAGNLANYSVKVPELHDSMNNIKEMLWARTTGLGFASDGGSYVTDVLPEISKGTIVQ